MSSLWTLFDKTSSEIIKEHQSSPGTADGSLPIGLDPSLAWLVESSAPQPSYDPNTHRLQPSETITLDSEDTRTGTRVFTMTPVPLSEDQLADKVIEATLKSEAEHVKAIVEKFKDDENVTQTELARVVKYVALRDRLDV